MDLATKADLTDLKLDLAGLRADLKADIAELKSTLRGDLLDYMKWAGGLLVALTGIFAAIVKLF